MKKIFFLCIVILISSLYLANAENNTDFNFSSLCNLNREQKSYNNSLPIVNYSKILTDDELKNVIKNIRLANMILSIMTMTGYTANTIIGILILHEKFNNMPYVNGLFYSHIPIGITSGLLAATVISLGYAELGIKKKYNINYSKAYSVMIFLNTAFAVAEIGFVVANLITSRLNPEAAKWIGLVHAITTATLTVGISVQFITSFIKP